MVNDQTMQTLPRLDVYMLGVYVQPSGIPDMPRPLQPGKVCAAPFHNWWYRAVTVQYYAEEDEVLVKLADYGGYLRLPRSDLRQIRTDFVSLPFQAVECYLAHVEPIDGTTKWSEDAFALFSSLIGERNLECYVVGYSIDDSKPVVELFATDDNNRVSIPHFAYFFFEI
ncbi:unnamed protein product [Gongylonema pulchrum]|uniref:Tudor domain-containing protein n=1 Tax=Gongylonema pulchrum TaxID=637853 RepID=A0A183DYU8_9BILA|nr:unnamed protein product [Gongylonema pulchrum]